MAVAALKRMRADFGTQPESVVAAIGPGIGMCCYEVGEEVARRFGMDRAGHLDLAADNLRQLLNHGVPPGRNRNCRGFAPSAIPRNFIRIAGTGKTQGA